MIVVLKAVRGQGDQMRLHTERLGGATGEEEASFAVENLAY